MELGFPIGQTYLAAADSELRSRNVEKALRLFDLAEANKSDPDLCSAGRWTCHMLAGNFELAWRESDRITSRGKPDRHQFWNGMSLDGKSVLLRCLHGLGDTIQFVRYAPLVREKAKRLVIEAQPLLKLLLEHARIADDVITWGEPEPPWDLQVEIIELPRIFRTTADSVPNRVPYLDIAPFEPALPHADQRSLRVGLVWASSNFNSYRSIPIGEIATLFSIPGISFFSLQAEPERQQLRPWAATVVDLYGDTACILTLARTLKTLDLVITVDTMVAHLAGALGRPVWTLLPFECDWRWMLHREDSPWYPTMRLFRQQVPGHWRPVVERVKRELTLIEHEWISTRRLA